MSWSGGKELVLALYYARRDPRYRVTHLLTSVNAHYERVSMHGVRLPEMPSMAEYD